MSNFTALNGRIERAKSLEDLSDVARAIEAAKKLSGVERRVLDAALTNRRACLARAAGTP